MDHLVGNGTCCTCTCYCIFSFNCMYKLVKAYFFDCQTVSWFSRYSSAYLSLFRGQIRLIGWVGAWLAGWLGDFCVISLVLQKAQISNCACK